MYVGTYVTYVTVAFQPKLQCPPTPKQMRSKRRMKVWYVATALLFWEKFGSNFQLLSYDSVLFDYGTLIN